jgi:hypothetical protein
MDVLCGFGGGLGGESGKGRAGSGNEIGREGEGGMVSRYTKNGKSRREIMGEERLRKKEERRREMVEYTVPFFCEDEA